MSGGARRRPRQHRRSPAVPGLVLFHAGALIPIELPAALEPREAETRSDTAKAGKREKKEQAKGEARGTIGHNLRWAFPLPDSGSFNRLLEALEEA